LSEYRDSVVSTVLRAFSTVVASILPMCSVVVLYLTPPGDGLKLGLIVMFSAIFSLALSIMTSGREIEVFAATAV
jgi:hypothetical protein